METKKYEINIFLDFLDLKSLVLQVKISSLKQIIIFQLSTQHNYEILILLKPNNGNFAKIMIFSPLAKN